MSIIYIPGPNNELVPVAPPDTSSRFPINGDFAISASWAATASYFVGFIESASYAKYAETSSFNLGFTLSASYAAFSATASYLLGSVANAVSASWANLSGHALTADSASYATTARTASYSQTGLTASYAVTSAYSLTSKTASYSIQANTASYAITASYLLGATATSSYSLFALTASYILNTATASYAVVSQTASIAETASYVKPSQVVVSGSGTAIAYIDTIRVDNIIVPTITDTFSSSLGNSAKWLLSITDGSSIKTSEVMGVWNPTTGTSNFAEISTNSIGTSPYSLSVSIISGSVRLVINPASGSWTVKAVRFLL